MRGRWGILKTALVIVGVTVAIVALGIPRVDQPVVPETTAQPTQAPATAATLPGTHYASPSFLEVGREYSFTTLESSGNQRSGLILAIDGSWIRVGRYGYEKWFSTQQIVYFD